MKTVKGFFGKYRFLSNFWPAEVELDGIKFPTTEHAYQAAKTLDVDTRKQIAALEKPGEAKKFPRKKEFSLRSDWDEVKLSVMEDLLRQKFQHPELKEKLLTTGNSHLEETNTWGDVFYGVYNGVGQNHLGRLLMKIRSEIMAEVNNE